MDRHRLGFSWGKLAGASRVGCHATPKLVNGVGWHAHATKGPFVYDPVPGVGMQDGIGLTQAHTL